MAENQGNMPGPGEYCAGDHLCGAHSAVDQSSSKTIISSLFASHVYIPYSI